MDSLPSKILVREMTAYFGIFKGEKKTVSKLLWYERSFFLFIFSLEPRGLIRLLQFIFAIFAFATACNGGSDLQIGDSIKADRITASWSYPYHLSDTPINTDLAKNQSSLSSSNSIKPSAEFFVFTGVTSMLLSFAFLIIYVLLDRQYRNDERFPTIDFLITLIWTIFWIAGSSAWGQGTTDIRSQTSIDYVTGLVTGCTNTTTITNTTTNTTATTTAYYCSVYECKYLSKQTDKKYIVVFLFFSGHLC